MTTPAEPVPIVGTGRHGSGYLSRLLCAAGVPCGHEQWWNPLGGRLPGLVADSSWCAVAMLPHRTDPDEVLLHQVRDPLDVITSLVREPLWGPYLRWAELTAGPEGSDRLEFACRVYVTLNQAVDECESMRWQVETVSAATIMAIADVLDRRVDARIAEQALATVPRDFNQHHDGPRLTWDGIGEDLPGGWAKAARDLGDSYGYQAG